MRPEKMPTDNVHKLRADEAAVSPNRDDAKRVPIARVCELCGDVSQMTIWRWMKRPKMDFPKPIYLGNRRYWRESDIVAWLEAQEQK